MRRWLACLLFAGCGGGKGRDLSMSEYCSERAAFTCAHLTSDACGYEFLGDCEAEFAQACCRANDCPTAPEPVSPSELAACRAFAEDPSCWVGGNGEECPGAEFEYPLIVGTLGAGCSQFAEAFCARGDECSLPAAGNDCFQVVYAECCGPTSDWCIEQAQWWYEPEDLTACLEVLETAPCGDLSPTPSAPSCVLVGRQ